MLSARSTSLLARFRVARRALQDGGEGSVGVVEDPSSAPNWALVRWANGTAANYRWGHGGKYDLMVIDPPAVEAGAGAGAGAGTGAGTVAAGAGGAAATEAASAAAPGMSSKPANDGNAAAEPDDHATEGGAAGGAGAAAEPEVKARRAFGDLGALERLLRAPTAVDANVADAEGAAGAAGAAGASADLQSQPQPARATLEGIIGDFVAVLRDWPQKGAMKGERVMQSEHLQRIDCCT